MEKSIPIPDLSDSRPERSIFLNSVFAVRLATSWAVDCSDPATPFILTVRSLNANEERIMSVGKLSLMVPTNEFTVGVEVRLENTESFVCVLRNVFSMSL